jgi:uncharacterized YigZ family protein
VLPSTIAAPLTHELIIKRSRFLAHLAPVATVDDADAVIARIRKEHWDASHNCVALIVGTHADRQRSSDDGEPSGTAGVPMLEVLRHRNMTDVVAVVTRYFGGVMLGAGGLVRAYGSAVSEALDVARIVRRRELLEATFDVEHADAGRVDYWLRDWAASHGAVLGTTSYGHRLATLTVLIPPDRTADFEAALAATTAGAVLPTFGTLRVADVE